MDSPTSIRRSLNLPLQSALDAQSYPTVQSVLDAYIQHPEVATLNQIMLPYLDIEELLILYRHSYEPFETRQTLNTLAIKYKLPTATTFKQLLRSYDMQYATVRSYLYNNRSPLEILYQAALEGEIQAMYNQLKLYPELRKKYVYTLTLKEAAEGGHRAIIDLLLELGADSYEILSGAAKGGHLDIVKEEVAAKGIISIPLGIAAYFAATNNRIEVLDYILSLDSSKAVLNGAISGAGQSGNIKLVEYLIAKGADNYTALLEGAAASGRLNIFKLYWGKVKADNVCYILSAAVDSGHLTVVKYLHKKGVVDTAMLYRVMNEDC